MRAREGLSPIRDHEAYFRAWRVAKFGGDFDPIRVAVDEAVVAFSSGNGEKGKSSDRRVWLKIANRVGLNGFLDAFEQKASEMRGLKRVGTDPAQRAFYRVFRGFSPLDDLGSGYKTREAAVTGRRLFALSNLLQFCRNFVGDL